MFFCRFLQCGSDVITTATYQASVEGFIKHLGLNPTEAEQLLMSGVQIAKETATDFMSSCTTAGVCHVIEIKHHFTCIPHFRIWKT